MREILFRGKRIDNGEWIEGNLIHSKASVGTDDLTVIIESCEWDNTQDWFNICKRARTIPSTICQYTGLTDKNGKRVFEGDIVRSGFETYLVRYDEIGAGFEFRLRNHNVIGFNKYTMEILEVIGNIYDNPKLLEG